MTALQKWPSYRGFVYSNVLIFRVFSIRWLLEDALTLLSHGFVYKLILTFESVDEILRCDHSNESY